MNTQHRASFSKIDFPAGANMREPQRPFSTPRHSHRGNVGRFVAGFLLVVFCAGAAWPLLPRRYESTASVILRPTDAQGRLDSVQSLRQPLDDNAIQSEMDIIGSPAIASGVIAHHNLADDPEFAGNPDSLSRRFLKSLYGVLPIASEWFGDLKGVSEGELREQLQKHLTVSRDRRSYTVKMGYWSSDPVKAAALTDTLLNTYLSNQLTRKRGSAEQHSAWLIERVEELQARYENSERAAREFGLGSDLTNGTLLNSLEAQLSVLSQEAAEIRSKIIAATSQSESTLSQRNKPPMAAAVVPGSISPVQTLDVRALELRLAVVDKALRAVREETTERHLANLKLESLRREAAIDKEQLDGALVRLKEQEPRTSSVGPGVEIIARPDAALRPNFPERSSVSGRNPRRRDRRRRCDGLEPARP